SRYSVDIDELMDRVGARIAQLLGAESAIVTAGAAAAFTLATAACVASGDPEKIQYLPQLDGLKNEVIMTRDSRNEYDQAIRAVGVKIITVSTREQFQSALNDRTAMVSLYGERIGSIPLEEIVQLAHQRNVPVAV